MAGREALGGLVALLLGVVTLAACERSPASSGTPSPTVAESATTPESTSGATTVTAPAPASPAGSTTQQTGAADTGSTGGGAGGDTGNGNGNDNGGGAVGSPIDVPTIPDPHASMDGLRPEIERDFVKACGGDTLCVHLVYTHGACFIGYSPSATAPRGSTVTVLTESQQECDAANGVAPEPTDEPTSQEPSDGASTGDSSGGSTGASNGASSAASSAGSGAGP
jgi:hypothetical protein